MTIAGKGGGIQWLLPIFPAREPNDFLALTRRSPIRGMPESSRVAPSIWVGGQLSLFNC